MTVALVVPVLPKNDGVMVARRIDMAATQTAMTRPRIDECRDDPRGAPTSVARLVALLITGAVNRIFTEESF